MQESIAKSWTAHHDTDVDEASVRSAFQPADKYRISRRHYPPETSFGGTMLRGTCVVLRGQCRFSFGQSSVTLRSGQFAEFPSGPYQLAVEGGGDLEIVLVWELPQSGCGTEDRTGDAD
jgi:mannose-6-phosphate isomerase-like protein (cupin superfamily)